MKHLNEERMIEHYYGQCDVRVEDHLKVCGECADAYSALARDLAALKVPELRARDAAYGEQVWRSLSPSLPVYEARGRDWLHLHRWHVLGYASACALLILVAFLAGRQWEQRRPQAVAHDDAQAKQPVVLVVLGDHLDSSERLLIELKHADASSADIASPLREEAMKLLAANHDCQVNAAQLDDPSLTAFLDHLGHVLTQLADEPGGLSGSTITRLQNEMNSDGLLFEARVLRSQIANQPRRNARSDGGTI